MRYLQISLITPSGSVWFSSILTPLVQITENNNIVDLTKCCELLLARNITCTINDFVLFMRHVLDSVEPGVATCNCELSINQCQSRSPFLTIIYNYLLFFGFLIYSSLPLRV